MHRDISKKIIKAKRYLENPERFHVEKFKATVKADHGVRNLKLENNVWNCDCDFYEENKICSHQIALEEFLKR